MRTIAPMLILLLLLNGCAGNVTVTHLQISPTAPLSHSATPSAVPLPPPSPKPTESIVSPTLAPMDSPISPTLKMPPKWHYDITSDGIFRTDQNTGDIVELHLDFAYGLIVTDDWIYFCDDSRLYRMDNENRRELLTDDGCSYLKLNGSWLYYINSSGICRVRTDGSETEQVLLGGCNRIVLTDQYVFYTLEVPESQELNDLPGAEDGPWYLGELHRIGLSGKDDVKVADMITELSGYENTVYYTDGDDGNLYSLNPNSLDKTSVNGVFYIDQLYFSNGYAFFIQNRHLYKMSLVDGVMTELTNGFWDSCWGILDDYVYVHINASDPDYSGLYRISIEGIDLERIWLDKN